MLNRVFFSILNPKQFVLVYLCMTYEDISRCSVKKSALGKLNVCRGASVSVIGVTRQDVENSVAHVVRALDRSTYGPQRGVLKEKQKGVEG